MNRIQKNLVAWITRQIYATKSHGQEKYQCNKLALHHIVNAKLGAEICSIEVRANKTDGEAISEADIDTFANEILNEAEQYAEGIGQTQAFIVASYFEDDPERTSARHAFTIRVDQQDDTANVLTEPTSLEGNNKALMRHNEAYARIMFSGMGQVMQSLQKQNEMMSTQLNKMFEERVELVETLETLFSAKHSRDMESRQQQASLGNKQQMMDNILALLPAVANKIVGRKILPEDANRDVTKLMLVKFIESINEEQLEKFMEPMGPEQRIAFIELVKSIQVETGTRTSNAAAS